VFLIFATALLVCSAGSSAAPDDPPAKADDKKGGIDRTGATKKRLLKEFGGSEESEEAVMLGLAWLTQMQQKDGHWVFEIGNHQHDQAAATGMAVLAFLGAGQSHKTGRYKQTVQSGLDWLVKNVKMGKGGDRGRFNTISNMYSQGIATLALCEAYGMSQDATLKEPAQAAIDYIQKAQGENGSWGYEAGNNGDTSIVGWQIQALHAAKLAQLKVDDKVIKKAIGFLDFAGAGQYKSVYGYANNGGAMAGTALTAIGLLCRYYVDGWRAENAGFKQGTRGLLNAAPSAKMGKELADLYYYYYATQVVRYFGGDEWKRWNEGNGKDGARKGGMSDWLIQQQDRTPAKRGSWAPEAGHFGRECGRLGTTCICLLTLEVYYRYDPAEQQKAAKKP
jgi:hypothetical protein